MTKHSNETVLIVDPKYGSTRSVRMAAALGMLAALSGLELVATPIDMALAEGEMDGLNDEE